MSAILLVDGNDVVIGSKEREALSEGDIYRVSALWMTNTQGEVLMAQRALTKKKSPGAWGPAAAGTVEVGEEYDTNIVKEIQEELGIGIPFEQLIPSENIRVKGETNDYFVQWYTLVLDIHLNQLTLQTEEVMRVKWFTPAELRKQIMEHPEEFTSASKYWLEIFLKIA